MAHYTVGDLLRDARERQKYSQEEVSYGICTASTLSRIENGVQVPGKKILEALMQRLGIVDRIYNIYLDKEELERYEIEQKLMRCLGKKEFARAEKLADMLAGKLKRAARNEYSVRMEEQYVSFARILIRKNQGESMEKVLEQLLSAIRMTIPEFDGVHIKTKLLTFHEITILNNIACTYHGMGRIWNGMQILFALKDYMEDHTLHGQEMSAKYPMILQNLSSWMGQEGHYQDALQLCQKGIDFCIEHGKLHTFPMLLCNKACALAELGQFDMSKECFYQSAAIFQAVGQQERAEQVKKYAAMHYGIA